MASTEFTRPTTWILAGGGIQVRYYAAEPTLFYQDKCLIRSFAGNEIRVADVPDVGTLISVTLVLTIDSGSTTFTLLLPRVNIPAPPMLPAFVPVAAEGVITVHHLGLVPAFQHGQQDQYTVTSLAGTAA
jgi:hypothetical protein